ncbi:hypothetical protein ACHAXT_003179 [Thalassiosira profunda]
MASRRPTLALSRREGYESFRNRAAVVDRESADASNRSSGLASVDEESVTASLTPSVVSTNRAEALKRLQRAASSPVVTNDLRLRSETDEGKKVGSDSLCSLPECIDIESSPSATPSSSIQRNAGPFTIIAFVNSASGGGQGSKIYKSLQSHLGSAHVFDLHSCCPGNFPEDVLIRYAHDPNVRVLACGGDGTCGWIFSSLDKVWAKMLGQTDRVHLSKYREHLPVGIMPLGTGNDLSRQFGWGGEFRASMKDKSMVTSMQTSRLAGLDRWRCTILPMQNLSEEEKQIIPKILGESIHPVGRQPEEENVQIRSTVGVLHSLLDEDDLIHVTASQKKAQNSAKMNMSEPSHQLFDGVFCNYFSLGFDATIAYHFHQEREAHPEKFTSPTRNKIVYVEKSPLALRAPKLRKLIKVFVHNDQGQLVKLNVPKNCRAIILMNIQSYGGGNKLTTRAGNPTDGLIEVIFVSNLIRAATAAAMGPVVPFLRFRVAAQTDNVCIRTRCPLHCQVDGEPWLQGEGVISVKFHSRNSMLEKVKDSINCGCKSGAEEAVIEC